MSAENKVVLINGEVHVTPGDPVASVVSVLEDLLQRAKAGEIVGIVGAQVYPSVSGYLLPASNFWGGFSDSTAAIGALEDAKFRMLQRITD